jgi:hypothetical protein
MGNLSMFCSTPYFFFIIFMHLFLNEICCENLYYPCINRNFRFIYQSYLNMLARLRCFGKVYQKHNGCMLRSCHNPTFGKVWGWTPLTLPKWGLGSPLRLPKLQSSIAGVKTPRLKTFLISLERYWSVHVENGLAWALWTSAA